MTRIRASCPQCGEVDLVPPDLRVQVVADATGGVCDGSSYRFTCPGCEQLVTKPADARIVDLLKGGGVQVHHVAPTDLEVELAELGRSGHPEHPPPGPPLSLDDLITFHALLTRDDWFEQLLSQD